MTNIYLAGPLFTLAEKMFNWHFAERLREELSNINIILPQLEIGKIEANQHFAQNAFKRCLDMVDECQLVIAVLDGSDADSGTCIEMGYAFSKGKPIIGVRTDLRSSEDRGLNLMVSNICTRLIWEPTDNIDALALEVSRAARELVNELIR